MGNATRSEAAAKPRKPRPDFPLFPHATGRWAKKVRGKLHYFGKIADDPRGERALNDWIDRKDALLAGRDPRTRRDAEGLTVAVLADLYLNAKRQRVESGEIQRRTFAEYLKACGGIVKVFGAGRVVADLGPEDFSRLRASLAKTRGPVALGNEVVKARMVFAWAWKNRLIEKPTEWGDSFEKPASRVLKKARAARGPKMFEAEELRLILGALDDKPVLKAAALLGINAAFGQADVAALPFKALDLAGGWVTFPRQKTGEERRAKLWPETVAAVESVIACRPAPRLPADRELVFLTPKGKRWLRGSQSDDPKTWRSKTDLIGAGFRVVLKALGIAGRRGFYGLRHAFQHAAENSLDLPAVMRVMGHADHSMSANYRGRITDERLTAVAETVRAWLWGEEGGAS